MHYLLTKHALIVHKVVNVYMAKAPGDVTNWDGSGSVWFKVHQITAVTNGGASITWPSTGMVSLPLRLTFLSTYVR